MADWLIHAHVLAEYGEGSLRALSDVQLEAVAQWVAEVADEPGPVDPP